MHVPPTWRRWLTRLGLALAVALVIAFVPELIGIDDRASRLREQLDDNQAEMARLRDENRRLEREIDALRNDVATIEDRARDELGWVYPGELVLRVERPAEQ